MDIIEKLKKILQTNRLILREFDPEKDAKNAYALNLDPDVIKYTGDPPFESVEAARAFLEAYTDYKVNGFGRWAVEDISKGQFLGWCGLKLHPDGMVDLGYRFMKAHWGKGFATESALACLAYGFEHLALEEIIGRTARENPASIKVLEKCGMHFWKEDACNGIEDSIYYRIAKKDFGPWNQQLYSLHG